MQYHVEGRWTHIFSVIVLCSVLQPTPPHSITLYYIVGPNYNFCKPTMTCRTLHWQGLGSLYSFLVWIHVVQLWIWPSVKRGKDITNEWQKNRQTGNGNYLKVWHSHPTPIPDPCTCVMTRSKHCNWRAPTRHWQSDWLKLKFNRILLLPLSWNIMTHNMASIEQTKRVIIFTQFLYLCYIDPTWDNKNIFFGKGRKWHRFDT